MFATIDIGTNSVLLLIGEPLPDGSVRVIEDRVIIARLGEGLAKMGAVSIEASRRNISALQNFMELCKLHNVERVTAVGTATLRMASNASEFLSAVHSELGIDIEVISNEREAKLTYTASAHDFGSDIVVIDIGGGSTEFVSPDEDRQLKIASIPIGCVSLTETFLKGNPPLREEVYHLRRNVREKLEEGVNPSFFARPHDRTLVATAGTASTLATMHLKLATYDASLVHGSLLKIDDLRDIIDMLRGRTIEERRALPGLVPERADVILAGAEFLQEAMSYLGFSNAIVSNRGVRWGLFYERFC